MNINRDINLMQSMEQKIVPWSAQNVIKRTQFYCVLRDGYPVTPGHLLFVPIENDHASIAAIFGAAYEWGSNMIVKGECDGFNVGLNCNHSAGQTVFWPHIHLIPRRTGDCADPRGGVRLCVPNGLGNYLNPQPTTDITNHNDSQTISQGH